MTDFIEKYIKPYAKAIIAFFVPGLAILVGPLTAGHPPVAADYWMALGAAISAFIAVYLIPNKQYDQGE